MTPFPMSTGTPMNLTKLSSSLLPYLLGLLGLGLLGTGCGDSEGDPGGTGGSIVVIPGNTCTFVLPPAEEPNLISGPDFGRDEISPGMTVEAEIEVDGDTRIVTVELMDFWELDSVPLGRETVETRGNESLFFSFPTTPDTLGRYFFRITLCKRDCDENRVLFTLLENPDNPNERNEPYQRIYFEGDTELRSEPTCLEPDSIVVQ